VTYSITSEDWENIKEQVNNKKVNFISGCYEKGIGYGCNISVSNGSDICFGSYTSYTINKFFECYHVDNYNAFVKKVINKANNIPLITFGKNNFIRLKTREHVVNNDLVNGLVNYYEIENIFTTNTIENSINTEKVFIKFKDGTILPVYNTKEKITSKVKEAINIEDKIYDLATNFKKRIDDDRKNMSWLREI
jgi:hypothetical protein